MSACACVICLRPMQGEPSVDVGVHQTCWNDHDETQALVSERALLDSDDFRDRHERSFRAHILEGPEAHLCNDLCSDAIINRLIDPTP